MTTPAILPSRNKDYGFFHALTVCPQRDRRSTEVWALASRLIAEAIRADNDVTSEKVEDQGRVYRAA